MARPVAASGIRWTMLAPALRLALGVWAAGIYLLYWLGYLGLR